MASKRSLISAGQSRKELRGHRHWTVHTSETGVVGEAHSFTVAKRLATQLKAEVVARARVPHQTAIAAMEKVISEEEAKRAKFAKDPAALFDEVHSLRLVSAAMEEISKARRTLAEAEAQAATVSVSVRHDAYVTKRRDLRVEV